MSITTDVITGFPGETDEEFEITYNNLVEMKLNKLHVFPYSKRVGTVAASMENQIKDDIKNERANRLIKLSGIEEEEFLETYNMRVIEIPTNVAVNRIDDNDIILTKPSAIVGIILPFNRLVAWFYKEN